MDVYLYMPIWPIHGGKKEKRRGDLTDTSCLFLKKNSKHHLSLEMNGDHDLKFKDWFTDKNNCTYISGNN